MQVPVHPVSRKLLKFVTFSRVYQFRALCFSLSPAPQVFTRVMAPVSLILHGFGIWTIGSSRLHLGRTSSARWRLSSPFVWSGASSSTRQSSTLYQLSEPSIWALYWTLYLSGLLLPSRVEKLQTAACFFLAGPPRGSLLPLSSRSVQSPPHEVAPADTLSLSGQSRRLCFDSMA